LQRSILVEFVGNDAQGSRAFDGAGNRALMQRAKAGAAPAVYLHLGVHELPQGLGILVINDLVRCGAEKALPFDRRGAGEVALGFAGGGHSERVWG